MEMVQNCFGMKIARFKKDKKVVIENEKSKNTWQLVIIFFISTAP